MKRPYMPADCDDQGRRPEGRDDRNDVPLARLALDALLPPGTDPWRLVLGAVKIVAALAAVLAVWTAALWPLL